MDNDQINEKDYVQGIVNGEEYAFKKIFMKYHELLCNFCWRYIKSKVVAEDLVQEVFADVWNLRTKLDASQSIRVYLYQAVKNKAFDYLDHQKVVRRFQKKQRHTGENFVSQERIIIENKEFIKKTRQAINDLPHRARQVYVLHREDGLTYAEIAEVLSISVKTVESQMSRALDMLRGQLRDDFPEQVTERTIAKIFSLGSTGTK